MAKAEDGKTIKTEDRSNGSINSSQQSVSTRRKTPPRRSWTAWLLDNVARLTVWYTIITVIFRCPSDTKSLTSTDPTICKPYLNLRSYTDPYTQPYYELYAEPYAEKARPYLDAANTKVIRPATVLAIDKYNLYAAPQVAKARDYTVSQWEANGLPQLRKVQESAQIVYDDSLAPHVQKASEAATPYYELARENAFKVNEKHIIPAISQVQPHLQSAYARVHKFALEKGVPSVQYAWSNAVIFVDGTLWPVLKKIYGDNVRPQLVMIGERIAKYQEGRKLQSAMSAVGGTTADKKSAPVTESLVAQVSSSVSSFTESIASTVPSSTSSSTSTASSQQPRVATDETISDDLVKWQKKFAIAADKGTDDLKERIDDIVSSIVRNDLGEGQGLKTALEKTVEVQLGSLKARINSVASALAADASDAETEKAQTEIVQAIREAGFEIRERAKNVRSWSDKFQRDLEARVELATESTLHVLDDIRDLGLQEIGMRWAWMDGVTYKHWQKYHDLKRKFADWRSEVRDIALSQPTIAEAQEQAAKLHEESMASTESAARELVRLRDVARWKISARDSSDDFDTRALPAAAAAAASAASSFASDVKGAFVGSSQGTIESMSSAAIDGIDQASSSASSLVAGTTDTVESLAFDASVAASELSGSASSVIIGTTGTIEALSSAASSSASDALADASSAILGTSTGTVESLSSSLLQGASSILSSASNSMSSAAYAGTVGPSDGIISSGSFIADSISSSASSVAASVSTSERS